MKKHITKAVFPVAGLGTRFLPATKASPKEMLPVVDKPLIQYAAEEAVAAGITELIFVTSSTKRAIEDHFDRSFELESVLANRAKNDLLALVRNILPDEVSCVYIRQAEALGLGHAVLCAKPVVGDEPFAVILADDLISDGSRGCLRQMVELYAKHGASLVAVEQVPMSDTDKYGIVATTPLEGRVSQIISIVEKPPPAAAPSNHAVVGRYLLNPRIFGFLEALGSTDGAEIQLTDGIARLLHEEQVMAYQFMGKRYDCGSKLGYLQATVEYGLQHPELGEAFRNYLDGFCAPQK
jgi:UTP--glucose-1-phosphate uridylyltransferase